LLRYRTFWDILNKRYTSFYQLSSSYSFLSDTAICLAICLNACFIKSIGMRTGLRVWLSNNNRVWSLPCLFLWTSFVKMYNIYTTSYFVRLNWQLTPKYSVSIFCAQIKKTYHKKFINCKLLYKMSPSTWCVDINCNIRHEWRCC